MHGIKRCGDVERHCDELFVFPSVCFVDGFVDKIDRVIRAMAFGEAVRPDVLIVWAHVAWAQVFQPCSVVPLSINVAAGDPSKVIERCGLLFFGDTLEIDVIPRGWLCLEWVLKLLLEV